MDMNKKTYLAICVAFAAAALNAGIQITAPQEGETVSQLWPEVIKFLEMPREARKVNALNLTKAQKKEFGKVRGAKPVEFAWQGDTNAVYTLTVKRLPDGKVFHAATVTGCTASVKGRLEIARKWEWTVSDGKESASGTFLTEDRAPRIISLEGVRNARDIGGRIGLNGRRIKQGLVLRTGGLNYNANSTYYTYDEILALHKEGKLATAGVGRSRGLGAEYEAKLKSGKGLDKTHLRLFKHGPDKPGAERLTPADKDFLLGFIGIKSDLDFRSDWECFGMTGSPLGDDVNWFHYCCVSGYGGFVSPTGRASAALAFSLFVDKKNYPIDFHCIGGTDRTGTFAYLLEGLLGVDEEDMIRDYEMSFIGGGGVDKRHYGWLETLIKAVRALPGDTLADKLEGYFLSLGYTKEQIEFVREFLLEPAPVH